MGWEKGQSGNPNGRPRKGETLTDALRAKLNKDLLAEKLLELVNDGDFQAIKYAYDRIDGRPKETIEQTIKNLPEVIEVDLSEDSTAAEDQESLEEQETL
jgi:hypothetical protein